MRHTIKERIKNYFNSNHHIHHYHSTFNSYSNDPENGSSCNINNDDNHIDDYFSCGIIFHLKSICEFIIKLVFGYNLFKTFIVVASLVVSASSSQNFTANGISSGCPSTSDPKCLKCDIDGCIKCPILLIIDNRQCTDSCPSGYLDQWSTNLNHMGRICLSKQSVNNKTYAALIGILFGFLLCLGFLIISVILIKRKKRRKTIKNILISENRIDRYDFLQQLNELRPNAEYILAMLNDTRRQIRKLYLSGDTTASDSYKPVVRDLAKLLILLNTPIELISPVPPQDWSRIYTWAEQALEQYKPQIGQLIDFFQNESTATVVQTDARFDSINSKHNQNYSSTFRSSGVAAGYYHHQHLHLHNGSGGHNILNTSSASNFKNSHHMQLFGSLISLQEFDDPRSTSKPDPFGSKLNTLKNGGGGTGNLLMTNAELNTSSLWLEDEFFKLGLRPQDEITTEL